VCGPHYNIEIDLLQTRGQACNQLGTPEGGEEFSEKSPNFYVHWL